MFENLRVYQAAELLDQEVQVLLTQVADGHSKDVDHLKRAIGSILYNIPEANGSVSVGRKRYHLEIARGSSDEARAVLRRLANNGALSRSSIKRPCGLTNIIAKMLTSMMNELPDE